jgi:prevent-host-death family protein
MASIWPLADLSRRVARTPAGVRVAQRRGETITITRRGRPIARLVPAGDEARDVGAVVEELLAERDRREGKRGHS